MIKNNNLDVCHELYERFCKIEKRLTTELPYLDVNCPQDIDFLNPNLIDYVNGYEAQLDFSGWYSPCPIEAFNREQWTAEYALLLFANIIPDKVIYVQVDSKINVHNCRLVGQKYRLTRCDPSEYSKNKISLGAPKKSWCIAEANKKREEDPYCESAYQDTYESADESVKIRIDSECELWDMHFSVAEDLLNKLVKLWVTRIESTSVEFDKDELHPISYYIEWIERQGLEDQVKWWAEAVEKGFIGKSQKTEKLPPYLDPEHTFYNPDIALLCKAHQAIFIDKTVIDNDSNIKESDQIIDFLKTHACERVHEKIKTEKGDTTLSRLALILRGNGYGKNHKKGFLHTLADSQK